MFELIRNHQMNIMLVLCTASAVMAFLLIITRFLPKRRKRILISMEVIATLLLGFDRLSYMYAGNTGSLAYFMVRLSNFIVFFLTSGIVFCFNFYLADLIGSKSAAVWISRRLRLVGIGSVIGMLLAVLTVFTGIYYYFDEMNCYHRGAGFLIAYIIPVICPLIQFSVIHKYRRLFSRFIYTALCFYIFVPITVGIIQIFTYGLSIVNMAVVLVSAFLYIFTYLDINDEVQKSHNIQMELLIDEQKRMKPLFSQAARTFAIAQEKRSEFLKDNAKKTADWALRIAKKCGKPNDVCLEAYNTALYHNAGIGTLPDSLIAKEDGLTKEEEKLIKNLPLVSEEILSNIQAFPYLSKNIRSLRERYDGKGYPDGLKGEAIPEVSRIVAVAEEYVSMTSRNKSRSALPMALVREEFVKESGLKFDPDFSNAMIHLMDIDTKQKTTDDSEVLETEIISKKYRETISAGIPVLNSYTNISFRATSTSPENKFSAPALILYDSFDKRSHDDQKSIDAYHYLEFGEIWFDGHIISTSARNMEVHVTEKELPDSDSTLFKVSAARFEDHILIKTESATKISEVIVALPDLSKAAYLALTGEECHLSEIKKEVTAKVLTSDSVPRIAEKISYIDHIESDIPNVQINSTCSAYSEGVLIKDRTKLSFHTMTLPEANLVWHCPYIVIYYSEDGKIGGKDYREYAFIKLNGEDNGSNKFAENNFSMKRKDSFENWNKWKENNKIGYECRIDFVKKGNTVSLKTENLGISIENTSKILEGTDEIYAAITGDQCAITDIRIL